MDTITTAIIAGIASLSKDAIKDAYNALKSALKQKFGQDSDLVDAVDKLEKKPDSKGRRNMLQEEVEAANINDDPDFIKLAQDLLYKIKEQPEGQQIITQNISNVKYAATSGTGSATISNITEKSTDMGN